MDGTGRERTVESPLEGTVVRVAVGPGDAVRSGQELVVIESMKMEHVLAAEAEGVVTSLSAEVGQLVRAGDVLLVTTESSSSSKATPTPAVDATATGASEIRHDLAEARERHEVGLDAARPDAVERRRRTGHRTTRENVADLVDPGSLIEYGPMVIAAQRRRRPLDDLIRRTPADGLVAGIGTGNGHRTIVMSYDYTGPAGAQGVEKQRQKRPLFEA